MHACVWVSDWEGYGVFFSLFHIFSFFINLLFFFLSSPIVQFDAYKSLFGGICTAIVIGVILVYIIITSKRFLDAPVNKSQIILDADSEGIEFPKVCMYVAMLLCMYDVCTCVCARNPVVLVLVLMIYFLSKFFSSKVGAQFTDGNGAPFYNDTYFYFLFTVNTILNSNTANKNTTVLNTTLCDYYRQLDENWAPLPADEEPVYHDIVCVRYDSILLIFSYNDNICCCHPFIQLLTARTTR